MGKVTDELVQDSPIDIHYGWNGILEEKSEDAGAHHAENTAKIVGSLNYTDRIPNDTDSTKVTIDDNIDESGVPMFAGGVDTADTDLDAADGTVSYIDMKGRGVITHGYSGANAIPFVERSTERSIRMETRDPSAENVLGPYDQVQGPY